MGVGDQVPPAIEQLGAKVEMIGPEELAWGNLSRFDTIVTGVRAYERRDGSARQQQPAARLREQRRHADRAVQQVRVQRRAVRAVSGEGERQPRHRRERAGQRCSRRAIRADAPNEITDVAGRTGCRSAVSTSSATTTRATTTCVALDDPFPYNTGDKPARSSRRRTARAVGLRRPGALASAAGRHRRRYQLLANLISLSKPAAPVSAPAPPRAPGR